MYKQFCLTLCYKIKGKRAGCETQEREIMNPRDPQARLKIYHIKVDWETLQIIMKYRDKLSHPMAGPNLFRGALKPGGLQRRASTQTLSIRSFIASFGVEFIKEVMPVGVASFFVSTACTNNIKSLSLHNETAHVA